MHPTMLTAVAGHSSTRDSAPFPQCPLGTGQIAPAGHVLIASSDLENRRALRQILYRNALDPICSSTVKESREILSEKAISLVFCDSWLADGSFRDLLDAVRVTRPQVRVVVMSRSTDWDEYLEAIRLCAFDVISYPCHPTDVEWMIIKAMREARQELQASEALRRGTLDDELGS